MSLFSWIRDKIRNLYCSQRIMMDALRYVEVPVREKPAEISQHDWDCLAKLNDKIALNITYDKSRASSAITGGVLPPKETIKRRTGICMDFAALFEAMARRKGYRVRSMMSDEMDHAWNEVELNGSWWIVDTAWNVPGPEFAGKPQRSEPNLLHRYFLTTVAEEVKWKRKNLLAQTHDCSDAAPVDYEKTLEAKKIIAASNRLVAQYNTLVQKQRDLVDRCNTNRERFNNLISEKYKTKTSGERELLEKKIDRGRQIIAKQDARIQKVNSTLTTSSQKIEKMLAEVEHLRKSYPLAIELEISETSRQIHSGW
ncbi:transglutaminase domain-containing protein [Varibaculum massiliense]|uniref:transglutaminase domain-containing protein n=1 Tax=Varibaculum massiliense TaxID=1852372 RepID=UPI00288A27C3|nr:transglutaminase domain-containing protein [Varibaculum massiliense]